MYSRTVSMSQISRRASRRRRLWRLVLLGVILAVLGSYVSPIRSYMERSRQIAQEQAATDDLRSQQQQLLNERDMLQGNDYVEQVARRDLGLVRPGEQPFVVKNLDEGEAAQSEPPSAPVEKPTIAGRVWDFLGRLLP